jgi:hypothetical protein
MDETQVGWIAAIIIGGIAGWLAEQFMHGNMGHLVEQDRARIFSRCNRAHVRRVVGASTAGRLWLRDHGIFPPVKVRPLACSVDQRSRTTLPLPRAAMGFLPPKRSDAEKVSERPQIRDRHRRGGA